LFSREGVFGGLASWLGWVAMRLRWGVGEWRMEWGFGEWCSWAVSDWVIAASRGGNATATAYRFKDDMDTDTDTDTHTDQFDSLRFGMSDNRAMHGSRRMVFFEDGQAVSCGLFGMSDQQANALGLGRWHILQDGQAIYCGSWTDGRFGVGL